MRHSRKLLLVLCLLFCLTQSGCSLLMLPFELLEDIIGPVVGPAVGFGTQAVETGIAEAPYAAPYFF